MAAQRPRRLFLKCSILDLKQPGTSYGDTAGEEGVPLPEFFDSVPFLLVLFPIGLLSFYQGPTKVMAQWPMGMSGKAAARRGERVRVRASERALGLPKFFSLLRLARMSDPECEKAGDGIGGRFFKKLETVPLQCKIRIIVSMGVG